jgi:hypothetical protein
MRNTSKSHRLAAVGVAVFVAQLWTMATPLTGQGQPAQGQAPAQGRGQAQAPGQQTSYRAPRSPYRDGHPDLNGIYQAMNFANMDLEDHSTSPGPFWQLGAIGGVPPGHGVVDGGRIPYQEWALDRKKFNFRNRLIADVDHKSMGDPELKCYLPGIPRANYMPYPFEIVETDRYILMAYTFANANRNILMKEHPGSPIDTWMGWSEGHWEGDTLVVEVTGFNDPVWLDRAGNFASGNLKVTERFTRITPYHLQYEATLDDPTVYTRPWKIRMPLYRNMDPSARLVEYRCVELSEEAIYGRLTMQPKPTVPPEMTPSTGPVPQPPKRASQ